jgi:hypothetical protein
LEISPENFTIDDEITITYYADRSYPVDDMIGLENAYFYSGIVTEENLPGGWTNVIGNWGVDDGIGLMTNVGEDTFQITITPRAYYNIQPDQKVARLGFVFSNPEGNREGKGPGLTDLFADVDFFTANYTFDNTLDEISGPENPVTFEGGEPEFRDDRFGNTASSLFFDGSDDLARVPFDPTLGQTWSISFWFKLDGDNFNEFFSFGNGYYAINQNEGFFFFEPSLAQLIQFTLPSSTTGWNHITLTYDGNNIGFYGNGEYQGEQPFQFLNDPESLIISNGTSGFASRFFGQFDDLIIEPVEVSADQVWGYYENFNPPNFTAVPFGNGQIQYSIDPIPRNNTTYSVFRDGATIYEDTSAGTFIDNVSNGVTYEYTIRSTDDLNNVSLLSEPLRVITFGGLLAQYGFEEDRFTAVDALGNFNGTNFGNLQFASDRFGNAESAC